MGRNVGGTAKGDGKNPANQFNLNVQNGQSRMQSQQPHRSSGNNPTAQNDYLNGLINQVQVNRGDGNPGPNNHMKIQGHVLQNIHKRSQSQHGNGSNTAVATSSLKGNSGLGVGHKKNPSKGPVQPGVFLGENDGQAATGPGQFLAQDNNRASANSQNNHKRPKSNLDGFLKGSKQGALQPQNELPQIEVQNRNHQRQANKTPVVQQSHPVPSKHMALAQSHDMTGSNTHS